MQGMRRSGPITLRILVLVVGCMAAAACAPNSAVMPAQSSSGTSTDGSSAMPVDFSQFTDIPIPGGADIDLEKTLVFGSSPWYGNLALETSADASAIFDFYRRNLPQHQWQEIASVRAATSILTYGTPDRVLTITITDATIRGANVMMIMSPRGAPGGELPAPPAQPIN